MESGKLYTGGFKKNIRRKFITGLLVVFPLFLTFIIIKFLFGLIGRTPFTFSEENLYFSRGFFLGTAQSMIL